MAMSFLKFIKDVPATQLHRRMHLVEMSLCDIAKYVAVFNSV